MLSHYDNQSRLPLLLLRCTGVLGCQVDLVCERLDMQEVLFVDVVRCQSTGGADRIDRPGHRRRVELNVEI